MDPLPFWTVYIGLGAICTIVELIRPAHKVRYRKAVVLDVIALLVYQFATVPLAALVTDPLLEHIYRPMALLGVWLPLRVVVFYLAADMGAYWLHRMMHTRHLWRLHRWHHSPTQLYWLAGVRASLPQQIVFNLPFIATVPLLIGGPLWLPAALVTVNVATNHWMHMNVSWRSNWLEWLFVTPRYHQIHHSSDAELHDGNYGTLFTIWDRMFGTYIDPETTRPKAFGTGEKKRDPVLLMIGV